MRFSAIVVVLLIVLTRPASTKQKELVELGKLPGTTGWTDEGYNTDYAVFLRPLGTLKAVMLFVDFPNAPVSEAPDGYRDTQPYYEWLAPAAREWFRTSSYGRLNLETTPVDRWYHMSRNDYEYGFRRGLTWEAHVEYIKEAVRLADNDVDFSLYDLVYIVPTRNASNITYSPAFIDDTDAAIIADRKPITHGVTFGQDMWHWGYKVLNHETLHTFGLPDTYAFVPKTVDSKNDWHYYVGGWDLMGLISGHAPDLFAWHKWKLGWIDDTQVDVVTAAGTTEHHLTPVERPGGPKMVVIRTGNTTAYVVESRRSLRNDSDAKDSGVLIYRVDSSVWTGHGCIQVIDASPGGDLWPSRDLDLACFGTGGGRVSTFTDEEAGITITVIRQAGENDFVRVTKTTNLELQ